MRKSISVLLAALLVAIAAVGAGSAATATLFDETIEFDDGDELELEFTWSDSIDDAENATADVEFYDEGAYAAEGDIDAADTLNGTVLELDSSDDVHEPATYDVDLNDSGTVTVTGADFDDDGTVDLETATDSTITADDDVDAVTLTADTVHTDTVDADEGNTSNETYAVDDVADLETGTEYRVLVEGDDTELDDVSEASDLIVPGSGGTLGDAGGPLVGAVVLVGIIALVAVVAKN